jgi:hypothetical protein
MVSFSERMGLTTPKLQIQRESLDSVLKNALWNTLYLNYFNDQPFYISQAAKPTRVLMNRLWMGHFHRNYDDAPNLQTIIAMVKDQFFKAKWFEVFDLLEFILNNFEQDEYNGGIDNAKNNRFCLTANSHLEKNLSAYRFVGLQLVEITSEEELTSIGEALSENVTSAVQIHLKRAIELFSDRLNPDYRNCIKESISAVEASAKMVTGDEKATLGKALTVIEKQYKLHGSLKTAFTALYGYSSDADGIRHALSEQSDLGQEDAKFMLVTCSAFINYLTVKTSNLEDTV